MIIMVYITCKDGEEARKIATYLIDNKLIACANIFPINSLYKWENKLEDTKEMVIIAKSIKEKFKEIEREVKKMHSYKAPCIVMIEISESNKDYLDWVKDELK
jgi:periplasmic divalent cation tolerance protein